MMDDDPTHTSSSSTSSNHLHVMFLAVLSLVAASFLTGNLRSCGGNQLFGWPLSAVCGFAGIATIIISTIAAAAVGAVIKGGEENANGEDNNDTQAVIEDTTLGLAEPLLPPESSSSNSRSTATNDGESSSSSTSSSSNESSYSMSSLDTEEGRLLQLDLDEAKELARIDHSLAIWRESILLVSYIVLTSLSFILGIEAVDLGQSDDSDENGTNAPVTLTDVAYIAGTLATLQLSYFLWKSILTSHQTSSKTLLDLRAVHVHPIRYSVERFDAYCDICSEEIHGECFRCTLCDFDYCLHCFKRGKENQDWAVLRGDAGVKVSEGAARRAGTLTYLCRSLELLLPYCLFVVLTAICLSVNVICQLFVPNIEGKLFDDLIASNMPSFLRGVRFLASYWVGLTVFEAVQRYSSRLISRRLRLDLRKKLFGRLISQDIAFFDSTRAGAMSRRVDGDVEDMSRPIPIIVNNVLQSAILITGALCCCLISSTRLTVLSAACIGPVAYLTYVSSNWGGNLEGQMIACEEEGNAIITEAMNNIRNVRALSAEDIEEARYGKILKRLRTKMHIDAIADIFIEVIEGTLEFLVEVLVLAFGGVAIVGEHPDALTVGQLIAFTLYWDMLRDGVQRIQDVFLDLAQAAGAAQRVFDLLDVHPDIPLQSGIAVTRASFCGDIRFQNVYFSYQSRPGHPVLRGLDLNIPVGGTAALIGTSGAGKTTAIHLLLRFYDPQAGCITVDGVDLKELNLKTLHNLIGFVSQDTKLCFGTIQDNLTYGLPWKPSDAEIEEAARAANCHEFIEDMDEGYDTHLGEAGVKLSGGQRQRLAIARAFLRKPRLLILDEATSHLDTENERLVQEGIDCLVDSIAGSNNGGKVVGDSHGDDEGTTRPNGQCTVIIIAHRLSTVRNADIIAVLQDGKVKEQGRHEELLNRGGLYAKLVAKQDAKAADVLPED